MLLLSQKEIKIRIRIMLIFVLLLAWDRRPVSALATADSKEKFYYIYFVTIVTNISQFVFRNIYGAEIIVVLMHLAT